MSRKGAKSRTHGPKLRSTGTKARAHVGRKRASSSGLEKKLAEALEREAATSEVLRVISSSPGELESVFQAMLANAVRICEAKFGVLYRYDGAFLVAASLDVPPAYADALRQRGSFQPTAGAPLDRLLQTKALFQTADASLERTLGPAAKYGGARSLIAVPMRRGDELVGALIIYRTEVRPFTDKQIELVENFAAQAVIAIENTRLLNELRQRTDDLTESLNQQTATSEVLGVISSSPGELEPVFQALLKNATRICEAAFGNMLLREEDSFRRVALHNAPPQYVEYSEREPLLRRTQSLARLLGIMQATQVADMAVVDPQSPVSRFGRARTLLNVPMIKESELIGIIGIYRQEVRPFTDKQIELVTNFAAQAVIAIENTRLLNELRQRTDDLSEALEQQTATSEVLQVISSSPGELEPVFEVILENATRSARPSSARWCCARVMRFVLSQCITRRLRSSKSGSAIPYFVLTPQAALVESSRQGKYSTLPTFGRTRATSTALRA